MGLFASIFVKIGEILAKKTLIIIRATLPEDKRLNKRTTARQFLKILKENKAKKKIYLVCDNAGYYRSNLIKKLLKKYEKSRIIYLPPYSPI